MYGFLTGMPVNNCGSFTMEINTGDLQSLAPIKDALLRDLVGDKITWTTSAEASIGNVGLLTVQLRNAGEVPPHVVTVLRVLAMKSLDTRCVPCVPHGKCLSWLHG